MPNAEPGTGSTTATRGTRRVVVVTRNANLSVGLIHQGYDVSDVRPDRYGDWTAAARTADGIVLELSDAVAAESAVQRLRASGIGVPVLLVSNDTPGWDTTAAHIGTAAIVLPLPISLPLLTTTLDELIDAGPVDIPPPPTNETEMLNAVAASVGLAISESGTLEPDDSSPLPRVRVDVSAPAPEAATDEAAPPEAAADDTAEPAAEEVAQPAAPPAPPGVPVGDFAESVLAWARERSGVAETAGIVAAELAERLDAGAAALLLPDGHEWRVSGGVGLRSLEHRIRLTANHWLVANVVNEREGLIVEDTDAAREQLAGAPLASWARYLAVPLADVNGLFVAARSTEPFTEQSIADALDVVREANSLLEDAIALRAVARTLAAFTDLED